MESKLDNILRKVQGLLAKADHPNTPPAEADTARNMAEALMLKYRIEESQLGAATTTTIGPVWRTIRVGRTGGEFIWSYRDILGTIIDHFDIRGVILTQRETDPDGTWASYYDADVVGYESDLRFVEAMFTAASLEFGKRLEPKYDPELSEQVNAYLMRSAGMEGRRIAQAIYGRDDKHLRPKVRAMFKAEAVARGEDPDVLLGKGINVKAFRKDYADGFCAELWSRLRRVRQATAEDRKSLVLAGRKNAIDEAFYGKYPTMKPQPTTTPRIGTGQDTCPKCAKAKSGYCREHMYLKPKASRSRQTNWAAFDRGSSAARQVDLGYKNTKVEGTGTTKQIGG